MTAPSRLLVVLALGLSAAACDHNTSNGNGDGSSSGNSDLAASASDDLAVPAPPDLAAPQTPLDLAVPEDLQILCDTDANQRACGGVCISMSECCTPADCPMPANGTATCDSTHHTCGVACAPGYRGCGALCIPSEPDDGGVSSSADGGTYGNSCCTDSDCPAIGEVCPSPGVACACPGGTTLCTASNRCIPNADCCTAADCPTPSNGTATCTAGSCGFTCNGGFNQCGGSCAPSTNQCCMSSDCPTNHDTPACSSGTCSGACDPGWADCNNNKKTDGCETNTQTDTGNCGGCGNTCPAINGSPSCAGGSCHITCNPGFADCDNNVNDGCEINTSNDPGHCGGCGNICVIPNGVAGCAGSACVVAACNPGFADCDGNPANGCETNLNSDPNSCATCGHQCTVANGTAGCAGGACTVASCNSGFSDCNGLAADGCEVNTNVDVNNCSTCGHQCSAANGTPGCAGGVCTVVGCTAGFANCDGNAANGCETNLTNDGANCGSCGHNCATTCTGQVTGTACTASTCGITGCAPGYYNLDGTCGDGCECHSVGPSAACAAPSNLGALGVGQTMTTSGNLVPTGTEGWYQVTMTNNTSTSYHPHVTLTNNPGTEFVIDIRIDCNGNVIGCGTEGGGSNGVTDWETLYTGGDPSQPGEFQPIPAVGNGGTILIHVYRQGAAATTCNSYTLTIGN
ncbi:MAG: uncharacterized protein JWM53_624 [bacterium]|nr:uncharacterized protein [bacterium]